MKEKRRGEYLVHIFYVQSSLCAFSYPFLTTALQGNSIFLYFTNKEGGLHLVKCVGPQPSVGAEIHTWGRVALMLCCLALGGGVHLRICKPKAESSGLFSGWRACRLQSAVTVSKNSFNRWAFSLVLQIQPSLELPPAIKKSNVSLFNMGFDFCCQVGGEWLFQNQTSQCYTPHLILTKTLSFHPHENWAPEGLIKLPKFAQLGRR